MGWDIHITDYKDLQILAKLRLFQNDRQKVCYIHLLLIDNNTDSYTQIFLTLQIDNDATFFSAYNFRHLVNMNGRNIFLQHSIAVVFLYLYRYLIL